MLRGYYKIQLLLVSQNILDALQSKQFNVLVQVIVAFLCREKLWLCESLPSCASDKKKLSKQKKKHLKSWTGSIATAAVYFFSLILFLLSLFSFLYAVQLLFSWLLLCWVKLIKLHACSAPQRHQHSFFLKTCLVFFPYGCCRKIVNQQMNNLPRVKSVFVMLKGLPSCVSENASSSHFLLKLCELTSS